MPTMSHNESETEVLLALAEVCHHMHLRNLMAAGDGNASWRFPDGRIAMTPTGVSKENLSPQDFAWLGPDGEVLRGRPSSERLMHLAVYRHCPEARCVLHAHPPTAIACSLAHPEWEEVPGTAMPEVILAAGRIPVVPYANPGTPALGEVLVPYLPEHRLMLLPRHGGIAWGESVAEVRSGMERLEHVCHILRMALGMGGFSPLPEEDLQVLRARRASLGPRLR
nr:class II aldolase/adducin family protein [uncultured Holophaga sp.]